MKLNLLSRIQFSILLFPLALIVFINGLAILERHIDSFYAFLWSFAFAALAMGYSWFCIWRKTIRWTRFRIDMTLVAIVVSLATGIFWATLLSKFLLGRSTETATILGGTVIIFLWMLMTVLIWQETGEERAARIGPNTGKAVLCPKCEYNMTGLYENHCPKCGTQYSIDQLIQTQKGDIESRL